MRIKRKVLPPTRPALVVQQAYQRRMDELIGLMHRDTVRTVSRTWKAKPPESLAMDKSPAALLNEAMARLVKRWTARFNKVAADMAKRFTRQSMGQAERTLKSSLQKNGLALSSWKLTPAANDAYQAVIAENVGLIKSIPQKYLGQVQGMVMRSVSQGGDLQQLTSDLTREYGVTRRRAELIARDQNAKATAVIVKTRQIEAGLTQAVWMHSGGGDHPRPSHLKAGKDRLVFDIAKGAFIDGEWIWPGQLINCRCTSRPIVEGLT